MKKQLMKFWKNKKGFTLVELIVVIAILAVLAGVLTPVVMNMVDKAKESAETANAKMLKNIGSICVTNGEITTGTFDALTDSTAIAKYLSGTWPTLKDGTTAMQLEITQAADGSYTITTNATVDGGSAPAST